MLHLTRIWHGLLPLDAHAQYGLHSCLLPLFNQKINQPYNTN